MKHIFYSLLILLSFGCAEAFAQAEYEVYIIPASADGTVKPDASGSYASKKQMSSTDGSTFTLDGVEVPYGKFAVYVEKVSSDNFTFYQLPSYAVSPIPANYPSPLLIAPTGSVITLPASGTYDFKYYSIKIDGISTTMIVASASVTSGIPAYPSRLYLVNSSGAEVAIPGDATTGEYKADVIVPQDFKISYEPKYTVDAFIFGPVNSTQSSITLSEAVPEAVAYATNTSATFNVAPDVRKYSGFSHVEINLKDGYIVVNNDIQTGIDTALETTCEPEYFTLDGKRISTYPASKGIYIERIGDNTRKIIIAR